MLNTGSFYFTSCVSISAFVSLVGILVVVTSSAVGIKIYAITAGIKKYKSIIKKKKKHDKIALLWKDKLNTIEVRISKSLIDSCIISHDEFVSVKNVLREYNEMKKKKTMETYCVSCKKYTANENSSVRKTKQNRLMLL